MGLGPIMLDVVGTEVAANEEALLRHPLTGGVILFAENYRDLNQLKALTKQIREIANKPLLITVDHEGGRVWRFHHEFTHLPSMQRFGELWDKDPQTALEQTTIAGRIMAQELLVCGVDLTLAPNLDIRNDDNPVVKERAFHKDPDVVTKLGTALLMGMRSVGMVATGKHYPGHGGCEVDTHEGQAIDTRAFPEIESKDLVPFVTLSTKLQAVLASHVIYPEVDSEPACFSKVWLDKLRQDLGFEGAILSDCLSMGAVADCGTLKERVEKALIAGCDMAIVSHFKREELSVLLDTLTWTSSPLSQQRLANLQADFDAIRFDEALPKLSVAM